MTPKEYTLTLTAEETQMVVNAVGNYPINQGLALFEKIKNQIVAQETHDDHKEVENGK